MQLCNKKWLALNQAYMIHLSGSENSSGKDTAKLSDIFSVLEITTRAGQKLCNILVQKVTIYIKSVV